MTTASSESPSSGNLLTLRVGQFEGPLDLLLHLCRTNEIDLAALPVRAITDQYVAHLEAMEFRDLETAGAYLVMAATLIYLKSMLLSSLTGGERRRPEIVVTMLAVLELVRLGRIRTQQTELFGDIIIERREDAPGDNGPLSVDSDLQGGTTVADAH